VKKIPTIFERDWTGDKSRVTDVCNPEALWVFQGEGVATRKYDGTAVLVEDGVLYCRYDAKNGKTPPPNFRPAQDAPDEETRHWPGWVPADKRQHKWQIAAFTSYVTGILPNGTYEACGPHFQSNPENYPSDLLVPHARAERFEDAPRTFVGLAEWFKGHDIEGLVWHHPDGRMAKIKKKDFGLRRDQ
jgi:hypothetical protein